ncbi:tetratricopeptide repeat protein [Orrella marina]|uniref:tetratricopeptide repeat protein n=1 Tax=Orrella marina TaxID=2163011 RepID=UPI00131EE57B|nr:tetratricopeptide repeat protein [Orrella marina]
MFTTSSKGWLGPAKCLSAALLAAAFSGACASPPASFAQDSDLEIRPLPQEDDVIVLQSDQLPGVRLTADVLYRLLVAEFAAQRGGFQPAADTSLELARFTGDPRLAQRAVEFYMLVGNYRGALSAVNAWRVIDPGNEEAQSMRLALMAAIGQTGGLVDALVEHVDARSDKTEALAQVMGILARMKDREEALQIITDVIDQSGQTGTMSAFMATADLAEAAQNYELAFEQASKALALDPGSEDAAMRVLDYGVPVDAQKAIAAARQFARSHPQARRLRLMLAGQMAEQGAIDEAFDELRLMSAEFPEDFDLLFIRAQFAFQMGRLDDASLLLSEFIEVQSQREDAMSAGATDATAALTDAYTLMSSIAERQGQHDRAVEWLGWIEDPTAMYSARLRQAKIRGDQGRVDEAVRMIDAAHPLDQDEQLIGVLTLTQILRQDGRIDQAIERLREADNQIPDSVEIKYELGMLLERKDDILGMERYLRQVIALDPGYAHAYNALGYTLADRGDRLGEALQLVTQAHQILPDDPYILDSLGWVKYRQGDLEQARRYLEQAYNMRPESEIAAHLGEVLWELGQQEAARAIWQEGLQINSQDPVLIETIQRYGADS